MLQTCNAFETPREPFVANTEKNLLHTKFFLLAQMKRLVEAFNLPHRNQYGLTQLSKKIATKGQKCLSFFLKNVMHSRHFFTLLSKKF